MQAKQSLGIMNDHVRTAIPPLGLALLMFGTIRFMHQIISHSRVRPYYIIFESYSLPWIVDATIPT